MSTSHRRVIVAVATPTEVELVGRIEAVDNRLEVRYQPDLMPPPGSPATTAGSTDFTAPPRRRPAGDGCWLTRKSYSVCPATPRRYWRSS